MQEYISMVRDYYDYVLIDCMPSLGMITINAFACADSILIPVQAAYLPVKGLGCYGSKRTKERTEHRGNGCYETVHGAFGTAGHERAVTGLYGGFAVYRWDAVTAFRYGCLLYTSPSPRD